MMAHNVKLKFGGVLHDSCSIGIPYIDGILLACEDEALQIIKKVYLEIYDAY
jgi:hypothetical protein